MKIIKWKRKVIGYEHKKNNWLHVFTVEEEFVREGKKRGKRMKVDYTITPSMVHPTRLVADIVLVVRQTARNLGITEKESLEIIVKIIKDYDKNKIFDKCNFYIF